MKKVNDIELYEIILSKMLDITENGDLFREDMEDRLLIGELEFLIMIIKNLLDTIPDKKQAYDLWRGIQTRLVEEWDTQQKDTNGLWRNLSLNWLKC